MTTSEGYVSIREAARRSGRTEDTLRYYDREGLLGELPRARGGQRLFGRHQGRSALPR